MKTNKVALVTVALAAAVLRIVAAFRFPFEQDELYTVDEAGKLFNTHIAPGIQARPVFFLFEHSFVKYLPLTEPWLRLTALLFGIAGVALLIVFVAKVLGDRAALAAALLVALSPWHLYASAFARYYSLLFLAATAVYWLLPRAYDSDNPGDYIWALVPLYLGCWTHPSFVFPVAGAVLAITIVGRDGEIRWRWPSSTAWRFLWLPLIVLSALTALAVHAVHGTADVANGGDRGLMATLRLIPAMVDWMTLVVATAALCGCVMLLRSDGPNHRRLGGMVLAGSICTIAALFGLSFKTAIYADYGVAALPLLMAAAAYLPAAVAESARPASSSPLFASVLGVIVVASLPGTLSFLSDGNRFDYRPAFRQIMSESPGTFALMSPIVLQMRYAPGLKAHDIPTNAASLDSMLTSHRDLWAVVSEKQYGIVGDDTGEIASWLSAHCREAGTYKRPRLDYRVYRVDLWRCQVGS